MDYKIERIESSFLQANTYLIHYNNKTIIIDPCVGVEVLKRYNVKEVEAILITHGHVDHILTLQEVVDFYKSKVYLTKNCLNKVYNDDYNLSNLFSPLNIKKDSFEYELIQDNSIIVDELNIKCITTPGHSNCSVCFLLKNDLFTGDTLFNRSVGRTDLYTGNSLEQRNSLKKLLNFNTNFVIYPGHDSSSTIDEQKKYNPYLKFFN